ncbi:SH3 domain-containing protein [Pseudaminobacter salicylatoxidans]|uniref:SH3 domain-containing protein n=1 Tax=Pseudaminobacter salicylatoxidans TaxID=93369 RepID=A0A316C1B6_PSESE|nr:DUF1236 domain-containing protein [Pseudaminobacter salicylatoxidans]PWJ82243.1 SH3 domain-containing protein [Pseudaminobacter salicylatoxidans]
MKTFLPIAAVGALFALTGTALADTAVSAVTDLNVRAGPGPQYPIIGLLAAGQRATLNGCLENSKWCTIAEAQGQGWVYSDYVTAEFGGSQVILTQRPANSGVAIVAAPDEGGGGAGMVTGGATGAIAGAIIGGPVGAAVGGAVGATAGGVTGTVIDPPEQVRTYVAAHQDAPVYLQGEVVTGATLPETVRLREVPDYEYRYVNVNGQLVFVEPQSRRIVYVMR